MHVGQAIAAGWPQPGVAQTDADVLSWDISASSQYPPRNYENVLLNTCIYTIYFYVYYVRIPYTHTDTEQRCVCSAAAAV